MPTGTLGTNARQDPRQVVNTLKKTVNFNDPAIAAGVAFDNPLPQGAFILRVLVEIVVAIMPAIAAHSMPASASARIEH